MRPSRTLSILASSLSLLGAHASTSHAAPITAAAAPSSPAPSREDQLAAARIDNAFAFDFYAKARTAKGNVVVSPFSIATALDMTWAGAHGNTSAQMAHVLHTDAMQKDRAIAILGAQSASYANASAPGPSLHVVNRLYGERTLAFEQPFLSTLGTSFQAPLEQVDFKGAPDASRVHINDWVATQTNQRIRDLVPPPAVTEDTRLSLVNAITFKGNWASQFTKESTSPAPFRAADSTHDVPTMHQVAYAPFAHTDGVSIVDLPYERGELVMTFVLPDAQSGLDAVEARLTPATLDRWIAAEKPGSVEVALPKTKVAPSAPMSLGSMLKDLGMPLAFDRSHADLTGIATLPDPRDRLAVDSVFHKAFLDIDEKGTEAAAATAVQVARTTAVELPSSPANAFRADHPFLFLLRDTRTGLVLFMGRVSDPSAA